MKRIELRSIDRYIISVLAALMAASGLYLAGPWYLVETNGNPSPLFALLSNTVGITIYGILCVVSGLVLGWFAHRRAPVRVQHLSLALLTVFLLRFYSLMGTLLTLESWRPPGYLSPLVIVLIIGGYWLWVVRNVQGTS
jgi:hypothetical protein